MLGNKNQQNISGNHNQQAGGNIVNISCNSPKVHTPSAIEIVLRGLYLIGSQDIKFTAPDILPYTIEEKIEFNKIEIYKKFYDDFLEGCSLVKAQINIQSEAAPGCEIALVNYVKSIYRQIIAENPTDTPNEKIFKICSYLSEELKNANAKLTIEELRAVEFVVFYVFSECKIFDKPRSKS